jgi:prolyl-tRNA synthetase
MRYSRLFPKTIKDSPVDEVAVNAKLLLRAGFIDKLMAGSYTLLPLGKRVEKKIEEIVREEMNATGAEEILMPLLHPKSIWNETGRWESADEVMYKLEKQDKEFALSFTHEEIFLDIIRKHISSYKDLPIMLYHFSTKFRSELRAKSGILRGREFLMKDLYSAHTSQKDLDKYYDLVKEAYLKTFKRLRLDAVVTEAAGGVFTDNITHEFQVIAETGEDEIIYCPGGDYSANVEVSKVKLPKECDLGHGPLKKVKSIEVGNIFRFGTSYSEKMNVSFTNDKGEKEFAHLGSYGIGITRLIGVLAEVFHDDKGLMWPESAAPFQVHLVGLSDDAGKIYDELEKNNIEVLYDDRTDKSAGEKFADADLIGIPIRLVVSKKTEGKVEWKKRSSEEVELLSIDEVLNRLKS